MELDSDQVCSFLIKLGLLVSLLLNSWNLWDKAKPYFHNIKMRIQSSRKRFR